MPQPYMVADQSLTLPRHFHNMMNSPEFSKAPLQIPSQSGILESKKPYDRI